MLDFQQPWIFTCASNQHPQIQLIVCKPEPSQIADTAPHAPHAHVPLYKKTFKEKLNLYVVFKVFKGSQVAERLGKWASNLKVAGSIPGRAADVVSLGKTLHPTTRYLFN